MNILVKGDGPTARAIRGRLMQDRNIRLLQDVPKMRNTPFFTIELEERPMVIRLLYPDWNGSSIVLDGVHGKLELNILNEVAKHTQRMIGIQRYQGVQTDLAIKIGVPFEEREAVENGVIDGVLQSIQPPVKRKMPDLLKWLALILSLFALCTSLAKAQVSNPSDLVKIDWVKVAGTNIPSTLYDATNNALRVNCVIGCGGGGGGGTSSNFNAAWPTAGTAAGFYDGTNMQGARVFDADSGAGSQFILGINLRKIASGGSVEFGTTADPVQVQSNGANLATDRTTAGAPFSFRLSNGSSFYDALAEGIFTGRVGEVQASPTANTLLGRLKSIEDKIDGLQTELNQKTEPANQQHAIIDSGTVTANAGTNLNTSALALDTTFTGGTARVKMTDVTAATGSITSTTCPGTGCVSLSGLSGMGSVYWTETGTFSLNLTSEMSSDSSLYIPVVCTSADGLTTSTTTGAQVNVTQGWRCAIPAGVTEFRVRANSFTSGSASIRITSNAASFARAWYGTVQDEGTALAQRVVVNFIGSSVNCVDNAGNTRTDCTVSAGGSVTVTETEIDFDSCGQGSDAQKIETCVATVTDASVSASSKILLTQSGNAPTGREADENEMDMLTCSAKPASGSFTLTCRNPESATHGKFKVLYTIG